MHPNRGKVAELDANKDITLETLDAEDINVHGRLPESQAHVYHLDLEHTQKVLSMQDTNEAELAEVKEVLEVVTAAKMMTKVVTTATTITTSQMPKASAPRRRKGVVIRDPEETATPSVIVHSEAKSKDKGKGILVEEPKPLKRQAQIEHDEAYARELEAELNANINWNDVMEHVKRKEKNTYKEIRPIFEKHYTSIKAFLYKGEKEIEEEGSKRKSESSLQKAAKKEDLEMLWKLVQERFQSSKPKNFSDDFLLNTLKTMFEKPNVEARI
nr:hypothetical protein [Tanacetum cinerariifolium]